ncbi:hypothetical protein QFZ82_001410 [Streptomyces sp. V4I23]|uniref:PP2C family protein-serine/threonine phosphatase n=1 Tax=Streptomyces sp. V4I23 TaxID=3042282 RepID=UPI0027889772|nr:hypothetical protein [Streptomyces sp. V4I23]
MRPPFRRLPGDTRRASLRAAAHRQATLAELVTYLDGSVCWGLAEPGETDRTGETFITAAIPDIPDQGGVVHMIDCGHPPPVVLRNGRATTIDAYQPAPPLGLGELARPRYQIDAFEFEAGDLLLLYTDGVVEARDSTGVSVHSPSGSRAGPRATPTRSCVASGVICSTTSGDGWATTPS